MSTSVPVTPPRGSTLPPALRGALWWALVGSAAGAVAGALVGGVGGRFAMLALRLTSPDGVRGLISDDGFEIGVVSTKTFNLMLGMAMIGAIDGVVYATLRTTIPRRLRLPLWTAFGGLVGGSTIVHEDGVDFTALSPRLLAILLFVVLPGLASAVVVLLVERWSAAVPWRSRRLGASLLVASAAGTFGGILALGVAAASVALLPLRPFAAHALRASTIVVPLLLAAASVVAAVDLVDESRRILD